MHGRLRRNDPRVVRQIFGKSLSGNTGYRGVLDVARAALFASPLGCNIFRRDPEAIGEWSLNNVQLCSQRQQRILADCWPALKENGLLIFSTCSYSREEDEEIMDWLQQELDAENCPLKINEQWGIQETASPGGNLGYRFWPRYEMLRLRNMEDSSLYLE